MIHDTVESREYCVNSWVYSSDYRQPCKIIELETLWGETSCLVWFPGRNLVKRIRVSQLIPLESAETCSQDYIGYITTAARIVDALTHNILLAPIESSIIPLPHQIYALSRAIGEDRIRYLLADEVGLGKTIEAGLIMRELKLRGLVQRTLIIAPKGLVDQWVSEMQFHFGEYFRLVLPEDIKTLKRIAVPREADSHAVGDIHSTNQSGNVWEMYDQVIVTMDSVKPLDKHRKWAKAQIDEYNRERFDDLVSAGWDLVIVDEAHKLGGSTDNIARYRLGQGLSEATPYILMLTATPHQGKTDAFHRLISLIDTQAFPDVESVSHHRVHPYVIRTEKRHTIDAEGKPLFLPRRTQLIPIKWEERHNSQKALYNTVTEYVRNGYNQAMLEKRGYIGFLMILMQRLVVSSTNAIKATLEKRLEALAIPQEQLDQFPLISNEEWADFDGQEQIDTLLSSKLKALKNERNEVKMLLAAANHCEHINPDVKAEALLDWLYRLQSEENDSNLKVIIFTEFISTQKMLEQFLSERGFGVVCINGTMNIDARKHAQWTFARDARILISTDAGGEGLNLQFCHVVINYDIPWNPMRLEQRIGRVDRIGQLRIVRAINFILENTVEHRVREVLEQKLAIIFNEFGIDKTADVLDSAQAGKMFDKMYIESIMNPEKVEKAVENVLIQLKEQMKTARKTSSVLGTTENLDPTEAQSLLAHPLPHWIEKMTTSYLRSHGGEAEKSDGFWCLTWPDGKIYDNVVFSVKELELLPTGHHLTFEDSKIRGLTEKLPPFVPGQLIPVVMIPDLAQEVTGFWALYQIKLVSIDWRKGKIIPVLLADNGKIYLPAARFIWDSFLSNDLQIQHYVESDVCQTIYEKLQEVAEIQGKSTYDMLKQEHLTRITRDKEKATFAFDARRKTIERIGLPQVRNYRLNLLINDERAFQEQCDQRANFYPEINPLIIVRVEATKNE